MKTRQIPDIVSESAFLYNGKFIPLCGNKSDKLLIY